MYNCKIILNRVQWFFKISMTQDFLSIIIKEKGRMQNGDKLRHVREQRLISIGEIIRHSDLIARYAISTLQQLKNEERLDMGHIFSRSEGETDKSLGVKDGFSEWQVGLHRQKHKYSFNLKNIP